MELMLIVWLVGTLPGIASMMCFLMFLTSFAAGATYVFTKICAFEIKDEVEKEQCTTTSKMGRNILIFSVPLWLFFLLVPDQKTAYQMLAAYGVQTIVQNETTQELDSDGVDVLKTLMKKAKSELEEVEKK